MMDPKWIKIGIGVASLVMGAVAGYPVGQVKMRDFRLQNEDSLKAEIARLKDDAKKEKYVITYNGSKCWYKKVGEL